MKKLNKKEKFVIREIAGDYIMMPVGGTAQKFSGLIMANEVSAFIWENIDKVYSVEELTKLICKEFVVDYKEAFTDTKELVEQMKVAGWIE